MDHLHRGYTDKEIADAYRNERLEKQLQELRWEVNDLKENISNDSKPTFISINQTRPTMPTIATILATLKDVQLAQKKIRK